ncbi:hypothetical protein CQA49_01370 [Helicobacter sp. MIT 00-7814]|uniref:hypothetical protein n=1 Tax=unclassified Helicobacter TaxID=2593540 RepID=UPI000E1EDF9B|nr:MULTISPECIES: hypothetical protein [unclassified Helicobacter]RDU53278.1 hypothetical protein CQA37_07115 [Helicobacter sp. MIT 99-10781]RDU56969.1 hypothetical protein CQA49_01370 [Helicobacter sp. MIT 00-7814]
MWLSSREFAVGINYETLKKACVRAFKNGKKILRINRQYFSYKYTHGIGRGGKILQIWSEPFASEQEAQEFALQATQEMAMQKMATQGTPIESGYLQPAPHTHNRENSAQLPSDTFSPLCVSQKSFTTLTTLTTLPKIGTSTRGQEERQGAKESQKWIIKNA